MLAGLSLVLALSAVPPDLAVSGVVVGKARERSSAVLTSGGKTRVVAVGETAFGGRLVSVGKDVVVMDFDGRSVQLRLPPVETPRATPRPQAAAAPPPPPGAPAVDPTTPPREMDRQEVQRRLGEEIPRILAETALTPVLEDGRVTGLRVARLAEGTLLSDAGLRAGDVLTRINGTDIDGMATLIGLWPRLQNATELDAVVVRNGQPVSLRVSLR